MKKLLPILLLSCAPLSAPAQSPTFTATFEAKYRQLRALPYVQTDSVHFTGDNIQKSNGFWQQRGKGRGWTKGERLTIDLAAHPADTVHIGELVKLYTQPMPKGIDKLASGHSASIYEEASHLFYIYRMDSKAQKLYFMKTQSEVEPSVPVSWMTTNYLDATTPNPFKNFSTAQLRQLALSRLWAGVKENFIFIDRMTENWDSLYCAMQPRMAAAKTNDECNLLLQEMIAHCHDGHTYVYGNRQTSRPTLPLNFITLEGGVYVDAVLSSSLAKQGVKRGMEVTHVDGMPIKEYGAKYVAPIESSSTPQWTDHLVYDWGHFTRRILGDTIRLTYRDGRHTFTLAHVSGADTKDIAAPQEPMLKFSVLKDNIGLLRISSFGSNAVKADFLKIYPELLKTRALIIDIRDNGGGNSNNADFILRHFTADSIRGPKWTSRRIVPAYTSWGRGLEYLPWQQNVMLPVMERERYLKPIALLVDGGTFSAAEDFTSVFIGMKRGPIIGEPTGGSTGNGVRIELMPDHSWANICSKHDLTPDGQPWVGYGLRPTIRVEETYTSHFKGESLVVKQAIKTLKATLSTKKRIL